MPYQLSGQFVVTNWMGSAQAAIVGGGGGAAAGPGAPKSAAFAAPATLSSIATEMPSFFFIIAPAQADFFANWSMNSSIFAPANSRCAMRKGGE